MPCKGDQEGHFTAAEAAQAGSIGFEGVARVCQFMAAAEVQDWEAVEQHRAESVAILQQAAGAFEDIAARQDAQAVEFAVNELPGDLAAEYGYYAGTLDAAGHPVPASLAQVSGIEAAQLHQLVATLADTQFQGNHADWYPGERLVQEVRRTLQVGLALSRVASLFGDDHRLEN